MKFIKYTLLTLLLLVIIAAAAVWFYLDSIVKTAVNKYGSQIVGTNVSLESFRLNPFNGELKLGGINIGNPNGYSAPSLLKLGGISVKVDMKSLLSDTIVVEDIRIDNPSITYEMPDFSTSNVMQIQQNVAKNTVSEDQKEVAEENKAEAESAKNVIIRKVLVEGGLLNAITPLQNNDTALNIDLPAVELANLGGENQKLTIRDSVTEIFNKILFNATSAVTKVLGSAKDMAKKAAGAALDNAAAAAEDTKGQAEGVLDAIKFW
ncbi:MAG: AsmA family protein [Alphaproteobacteria bacterium]|nr:AsmA family protein [Alphaproteobacteria bacterium]